MTFDWSSRRLSRAMTRVNGSRGGGGAVSRRGRWSCRCRCSGCRRRRRGADAPPRGKRRHERRSRQLHCHLGIGVLYEGRWIDGDARPVGDRTGDDRFAGAAVDRKQHMQLHNNDGFILAGSSAYCHVYVVVAVPTLTCALTQAQGGVPGTHGFDISDRSVVVYRYDSARTRHDIRRFRSPSRNRLARTSTSPKVRKSPLRASTRTSGAAVAFHA